MKKLIALVLTIVCVLGLTGCNNKSMNNIIANKPSVTGIVEEVHDDYIIVYAEKADGYPNGSNWSISLNVENKDSYTNVVVGDEIVFYYDGIAAETEPLQVSTVYAITLKTPADRIINETIEETITYNGKKYLKSELCDATLHWLELSEEERMLSSYIPPEFMNFEEKTWGITLTVEKITSTSATIKCTQSGGEPTGELHAGSWYFLENWTQENGWEEMPYVIDGEITWNDIAWMIPMENTVEWEINWEWLYGAVPKGKYRIGKEITDFRATGDYDKAVYSVEFEIE
jgi:hypothetical protein